MEKIDYCKPIPSLPFPAHGAEYEANDEPLIELSELKCSRLIYTPVYYEAGLLHAQNRCFLRKGTAKRLLDALSLLPEAYGFKIFDAWRPFALQQALFDNYRAQVAADSPALSDEEIDVIANKFVSVPARDENRPPVHTTGGSVDLTVTDLTSGKDLDMGTPFDYFGAEANTAYFEGTENIPVIANRRLLYNVMLSAGFQNLPSEWWHFDYGNAYWAFFTGKRARYRGIFELALP